MSLLQEQRVLKNPCGNKLETFPLPNDPDRAKITVALRGTSKLDFHLDLCLRLSEYSSTAVGIVCVARNYSSISSVRLYIHWSILVAD